MRSYINPKLKETLTYEIVESVIILNNGDKENEKVMVTGDTENEEI